MISVIMIFTATVAIDTATAQTNFNPDLYAFTIQEGDVWSYYKGVQDPPHKWYSYDFNDSTWQSGPSAFGYGQGFNRTYLSDMQGNYDTIYARHIFMISKPQKVAGMSLSVFCDGPFIAYLNDIEVIRTNTISTMSSDQLLSAPQAERYNISGFIHELMPGNNILAVQCSNDDIISSNFSFVPYFEVLTNGEVQ